ncbi:MAG: putative toxin-antitoxin system toxin component, PIN family [Bacteroidetes bacterium]|jgi:putative PIN family toxin of toxin-antitoxin system|nr:putative toxin-antitoxin system toxin component, PIN family [Bacteroidota bacterium]
MKKTNLFVLDANALISAFLLAGNSIAAQAYNLVKEKGNLVFSEDTFNEFSDVFVRPKFDRYLSLEKRLVIIEDLKTIVSFVSITSSVQICRDPKDNKYLELALSAGAACIVTGDKDLLVLHLFHQIPILTAADFLKTF